MYKCCRNTNCLNVSPYVRKLVWFNINYSGKILLYSSEKRTTFYLNTYTYFTVEQSVSKPNIVFVRIVVANKLEVFTNAM